MLSRSALAAALLLPLAFAGCSSETPGGDASPSPTPAGQDCAFDKTVGGVTVKQEAGGIPTVTIAKDAPRPKKLKTVDLCVGSGTAVTNEYAVLVDTIGVGYDSRKVFEDTFASGSPAPFSLAPGSLIQGWIEGIPGMQVGGARLLLLPPEYAYGDSSGRPPDVGKNDSLAFLVELRDAITLAELQSVAPPPVP